MTCKRARIHVHGAVQGVGFRPFVFRLAGELDLAGWVLNSPQGVAIEVEGAEENLQRFWRRLESEKPPAATIHAVELSLLEPACYNGFEIRDSLAAGARSASILPDLATCADCVRELFDPRNRRHLYPFTNCTHCGPRFSIIEALPYDRANTSMKTFTMCVECEREYRDPNNRRFHAQPNACPQCGPQLELWDAAGRKLYDRHDALQRGAGAVRTGKILALKGVGGFQLIVDARNEAAVRRLRERKHRLEKPFALMFPSLNSVRENCRVTDLEQQLLLSQQSPIVLVEKLDGKARSRQAIAASVAPANPQLGVMLPYSPLHHLFLRALRIPIVATSGNTSDEPICIDEQEALERLAGIADLFLVHNRPIVRHVDDSVVRVVLNRELVLRCARGYAPVEVHSGKAAVSGASVLAVGAHLKNTVALSTGKQIHVSQHLGDLENEQALVAFRKSAADLPRHYETVPQMIACDLHPEYLSTKFAEQFVASEASDGKSPHFVAVQHHYAHVLSCMAENNMDAPVLGVCWDGTGYGPDHTIWGGEFLLIDDCSFERVAHLRQFRLPGGEAAVKQPRRSGLGLLHEVLGNGAGERFEPELLRHFSEMELRMLNRVIDIGLNSPLTSSAGRLFDGVAAIIGLRERVSFEGQAAMELEFAIRPGIENVYRFKMQGQRPLVVDWQPMVLEILGDLRQRQPAGVIAAKFHNTLVEMIVAVAKRIGEHTVVVTGGCFQNKYLTERTVRRLREEGFCPYWHRRIPPNDGGIALGQIVAALRGERRREEEDDVEDADSPVLTSVAE